MEYLSCYPTLVKSKRGHERGQISMGFHVVEKLRSCAFQPHQNNQNPVKIDLIHGHVLILLIWDTAENISLYTEY